MEDRIYWIWLSEALGQGSPWGPMLVRRYGGAKAVFEGAADAMEADDEVKDETLSMIRGKLKNRSLDRAEEIAARKPYAVVLATGGTPVRPRSIQGIDRENVKLVAGLLIRLREEGTALLLSGHVAEQLRQICSHALLLEEGVMEGPVPMEAEDGEEGE